jgi:hypothetical protein
VSPAKRCLVWRCRRGRMMRRVRLRACDASLMLNARLTFGPFGSLPMTSSAAFAYLIEDTLAMFPLALLAGRFVAEDTPDLAGPATVTCDVAAFHGRGLALIHGRARRHNQCGIRRIRIRDEVLPDDFDGGRRREAAGLCRPGAEARDSVRSGPRRSAPEQRRRLTRYTPTWAGVKSQDEFCIRYNTMPILGHRHVGLGQLVTVLSIGASN